MRFSSEERETGRRSREGATGGEPEPEAERGPFGYYYDDGTGYEPFDPSKADDEDEDYAGEEEA